MKRRFRLPSVNFTQVPNNIFAWFPQLPDCAKLVYLALFRLTWGFQKHEDTVAISQIVELIAVPRRSVNRGINVLKNLGLIRVTGSSRHPRVIKPLWHLPKSGEAIQALQDGTFGPTVGPHRPTPNKKEKNGLRIVP